MNIRTELKKFARGFLYAWQGLVYCVKTQRNFRFHMGAAVGVIWGAQICEFDKGTLCLLIIIIGAVLALEALNTAVEAAVDLCSKGERSALAKAAKDCSAGAVLFFSGSAAVVGIMQFFNAESRALIAGYFSGKPLMIAAAVIYAALWFVWTFVCFAEKEDVK